MLNIGWRNAKKALEMLGETKNFKYSFDMKDELEIYLSIEVEVHIKDESENSEDAKTLFKLVESNFHYWWTKYKHPNFKNMNSNIELGYMGIAKEAWIAAKMATLT